MWATWCPWELQDHGRHWEYSEFEAGDSRDKEPCKAPRSLCVPPLLVPPLSPAPRHPHPNWTWVPSLIPPFLDPHLSALMLCQHSPTHCSLLRAMASGSPAWRPPILCHAVPTPSLPMPSPHRPSIWWGPAHLSTSHHSPFPT